MTSYLLLFIYICILAICCLLFDIFYFISDNFYLKLAISCKNLFPFAPVVRLVIFQFLIPIYKYKCRVEIQNNFFWNSGPPYPHTHPNPTTTETQLQHSGAPKSIVWLGTTIKATNMTLTTTTTATSTKTITTTAMELLLTTTKQQSN